MDVSQFVYSLSEGEPGLFAVSVIKNSAATGSFVQRFFLK